MERTLLVEEGSASLELKERTHRWWLEAMDRLGDDVCIDTESSLKSRVDAARNAGLQIGTIYSRFSTKLQHSTDAQVRECIQWAARNQIYVPPELISVDEGVKGTQSILGQAGLRQAGRASRRRGRDGYV